MPFECTCHRREFLPRVMDHVPCRRQRKSRDIDHTHSVFSALSVQSVAGNHTDTQTASHGLFDRLIATQLQPHVRTKFLAFEVLICRHPGA